MDVLAPAWGRSAGIQHGSSREFMEDWGVSNARFLCWSVERSWKTSRSNWLWHAVACFKVGLPRLEIFGDSLAKHRNQQLEVTFTSPVNSVAKFHPRLLGRGVFTQQAAEFSTHWTWGQETHVGFTILRSLYWNPYIYIYINWSKSYKLWFATFPRMESTKWQLFQA